MKGYCTIREEWLYPDQALEELPEEVELHTARNGREAVRLLLETAQSALPVRIEGADGLDFELFQLIDVAVGYNEVETEEQNGMFVITAESYEKPDYCTRKAPFRVYEALRPITDHLPSKNNRCALYLTVAPREDMAAGPHCFCLCVGDYSLKVTLFLHEVEIPKETLGITNWFSLDNVAFRHGLTLGTSEYFDMLRLYAQAMRRVRQTHFFISYDRRRVTQNREKLLFDFSYLKPIIALFFSEGFETMEFGNFGTKYDDLFTREIKCEIDPSVTLSSDEGYSLNQAFIKALAVFLRENGWEDKTIFHVFDEPDVHIQSPEAMEMRKQQYFRVTNLLRKYIPGCKTIEAVKTTRFKGGVDIWVPLTANYEELREDFNRMIEAGEEVWCYVCCVPTGKYLNRFLDIELLKSRLLFWGCSKYALSGYLHWGFNYWPQENYDPFEQSNTPNTPFNGIYPSGDAYIVYPGENGPWLGLRLEAQRRGAEDYELLQLVKNRDAKEYEEIMNQVFRSYTDYDCDAAAFEKVRKRILELLEQSCAFNG